MSLGIGVSVQRLRNKLRDAYAVLGISPKFRADFIRNKYKGHSTFSSAITHARAGNAVMTDGYGPELVTNGGFDSDSDWTLGTGFSIADGVLSVSNATNQSAQQQITDVVSGKTYVIQFTVSNYVSGSVRAQIGGATSFFSSAGTHTGIVTATSTPQTLLLTVGGVAASFTIDNVSVREMPVLKWAPHNLLTYSEDFSNSAWSDASAGTTTVTPNSQTAPNGTETADTVVGDNNNTWLYQNKPASLKQAATYTFRVWLKAPISQSLTLIWYNPGGEATSSKSVDVTTEWQLFEHTVTYTTSTGNFGPVLNIGNGKTFYAWGAHAYRSDLGGMVDNPDRGDSYVPTTSSAKQLPRIFHHVYNGSAWANEGLLAESESRVNRLPRSSFALTWGESAGSLNPNAAVAPDGTQTAVNYIANNGATSVYLAQNTNIVSGTTYTQSIYAKAKDTSWIQLAPSSGFTSTYQNFDLANGVLGNGDVAQANIEDVGNGWYRCSVTVTANNTIFGRILVAWVSGDDGRLDANGSFTPNGSQGVYLWDAQLEIGSTPSSLIPTSGSSVSRAAESFTIPSANLPWPEPQYIGSELVTDISPSAWTASGLNTVTQDVSGNTVITYVDSSSGADFLLTTANGGLTQNLVSGKLYELSVTLDTGGDTIGLLRATSLTPNYNINVTTSGFETFTNIFMSDGSELFRIDSMGAGEVATISNISVREINPLSVSIGMEGRMTYADTNSTSEVTFVGWPATGSQPYIRNFMRTNGSYKGALLFKQYDGSTADNTFESVPGSYSPDILVPFSIASRHGSTFINGATDGVALTANTTPTRLPDLSSTDLDLAYDYMGTISEFRIWDKDITDDGLVEATNPSLEPSLSLTFEGTGTNSFVVNNWSE